ncbi:alpha/beta fold hydrolase [Catenulispora rubra]|uniref:alpha/beta fold hydrolase n=1 Tax=Catenulispora rubra TaxID=280293 RepID=UPI0018920535|nr:alpha/beta hydrolase [Catenulispora rubra]
MPAAVANGIRQNHEVLLPRDGSVDPPTIVCVHGILIDSLASYYFTVAQALRDAGFRVVLYDLRGHGKSEQPASGYRVDDFVEDLAGLLDALDVSTASFLGNSFGGTVVYGFAARHPHRVAGIVAIESEPATAAWSTKMAANLHKAATQLGTWEATAWITARYGRDLARRAKRAARLLGATALERDLPASTVLSEADIAAITCPTLALYGSKSDLAAQAAHLRTLMPRCEPVILPGLEHSVLVEAPARVLDLILGWLEAHRLAERGSV